MGQTSERVRHDDADFSVTDATGAPMPQKLQSHIGRHLQAMYDEVAQEPVPERLLNLLQELERKEKDG